MNTFQPSRRGALAAAFAITLLAGDRFAHAQSPPIQTDLETRQVALTLRAATPAAVLDALSTQLQCSVLMDGEPLSQQIDIDLHSAARKAIEEVAERLDCTWTLGRRGVVLLRKRLRVRGDLPQMHLLEMQKMTADVLRIWPEAPSQARVSHYPFTAVGIFPANALFRAFSPEQVRVLESGQTLAFAHLTPPQQGLVRLGIYNGVVGTSRDVWEKLEARLKGAAVGGAARLQWRPWQWEWAGFDKARPKPEDYSLDYIWRNREGKEEYMRLLTFRDIPAEKPPASQKKGVLAERKGGQ